MGTAVAAKPKTCTIYGRLSFPAFTAQQAFDRSQSGKYPAKSVAEAKPDFQLLVEPTQLDKLRSHITGVYLPFCVQRKQDGEKRDAFTAAEAKGLTEQLNDPEFAGVHNIPIKAMSEKSLELAPECVATVKVFGNAGVDLELKAVVNSDAELTVPDPDQLTWPAIKPIDQTVHSMYPGCYVAVTINLYSYLTGKVPGVSAGASVAIFKGDNERFGGGIAVDEDEIFLND